MMEQMVCHFSRPVYTYFDNPIDEWLENEFNEIKQTIAAEKAITVPGWMIMFTVPQWRTRLMHGVAVQVFTQLSGISESASALFVRL
jgi:hypothetical protein